MPKFDIRNTKRKVSDLRMNQEIPSIKEDWNSHARITSFLFPLIKEKKKFHKEISISVSNKTNTNDVYHFHLGESIP